MKTNLGQPTGQHWVVFFLVIGFANWYCQLVLPKKILGFW
jgi:hypothetical protein